MSRLALLATTTIAAAFAALAGCSSAGSDEPPPPAPTDLASSMRAYADDPAFRREALERSLVRRDNAYAVLRLSRYDEKNWGSLPEFDVPSAPIMLGADGAPAPAPATAAPTWRTIDASASGWSLEELRALGERAFFEYPVQPSDTMPSALASKDHAGVWEDEGRLGAVWATYPHGLVRAAFTCATCHASKVGEQLVAGRNNADLDAARVFDFAASSPTGQLAAPPPSWGRGLVDVTQDGIDNPVAITDLRPIRHQRNLHHAATLKNDPVALAVRIETLMITSQGQSVRPPRKIVAALAVYLLSLAPDKPLPQGPGAAVFARECGSCHNGEGVSGAPVGLAAVGTDPLVGSSPDRWTGFYRVPSLRMVGDRRRMFASGAIEDLDALLAPNRAVPGHRFGLDLPATDRAALLAYLRAL